jgi:dipeptidyl aminopeptidase/acylaminoacyl peptidase
MRPVLAHIVPPRLYHRRMLCVAALVALFGLLALVLTVAARTAWREYKALSPPRTLSKRTEPNRELTAMHEVAFRSSDGLTLKGWYVPSRNRAAVILVHGYGGNRSELLPEARLLAKHRFGVLLFDSRAHGESEGEILTYGDRERRDLRAAVDFLARQADIDPERVGALGFSAGASAVVLAAAEDQRLRAIALEAPATSLRDFCADEFGRLAWLKTWPTELALRLGGVDIDVLEMKAAARRVAPRPLLVVHGEADRTVPVARGRQLHAAAGQPKRLWVVPGAAHGGYAEVDPAGYERALLQLFDDALVRR